MVSLTVEFFNAQPLLKSFGLKDLMEHYLDFHGEAEERPVEVSVSRGVSGSAAKNAMDPKDTPLLNMNKNGIFVITVQMFGLRVLGDRLGSARLPGSGVQSVVEDRG